MFFHTVLSSCQACKDAAKGDGDEDQDSISSRSDPTCRSFITHRTKNGWTSKPMPHSHRERCFLEASCPPQDKRDEADTSEPIEEAETSEPVEEKDPFVTGSQAR